MTLITSLAIVCVASVLGTWINDHTNLGGDYLSDESLNT